jgi:hypothetical protein
LLRNNYNHGRDFTERLLVSKSVIFAKGWCRYCYKKICKVDKITKAFEMRLLNVKQKLYFIEVVLKVF